MKIKLEDKTFEQTKFRGRTLRNLLEIQGQLEVKQEEGTFKAEDLDMMCEFLVNVFDNQFTSDDVLDNLEFFEIIQYFKQVAEEIMKRTNSKMGALTKK